VGPRDAVLFAVIALPPATKAPSVAAASGAQRFEVVVHCSDPRLLAVLHAHVARVLRETPAATTSAATAAATSAATAVEAAPPPASLAAEAALRASLRARLDGLQGALRTSARDQRLAEGPFDLAHRAATGGSTANALAAAALLANAHNAAAPQSSSPSEGNEGALLAQRLLEAFRALRAATGSHAHLTFD
jgi:hypothetical protein